MPDEIPVEIEPTASNPQTWQQLINDVCERMDRLMGNTADQMRAAANAVREEARASGDEAAVGQVEKVARSLEQAALYLDSRRLDEIGAGVKAAIAARPGAALLIAIIAGLVVGYFLGRR